MALKIRSKGELCGLEWVRRSSRPEYDAPVDRCIRVVDLFCGCGGLTLGAAEAARDAEMGIDVRFALDFSEDVIEVYRRNLKIDKKIGVCADVNEFLRGEPGDRPSRAEIAWVDRVGTVDLLVAGPPCQGHSDLNNSTRRCDPRNGLYLKVLRAAELTCPKAVIIENVPPIIHDRSGVIAEALRIFKRLGYQTSATIVNAAFLGLPQRRRRHVLVALAKGNFDVKKCVEGAKGKIQTPLSEFLTDLQDEPSNRSGIFYSPAQVNTTNQREG